MKYLRRVIRITALDSPNVRRELARRRGEPEESWPPEVPGVLTWQEYQRRLAAWDDVRKTIGLSAEFWEGSDALLFPPAWLDRAEEIAERLRGRKRRPFAIGIDPGEGGDRTAMCCVDSLGVVELVSRRTPNTDDVPREALAFMRKHGVDPENVIFDRGGGGKQHADRLRGQGYPVRTLAFGESVQDRHDGESGRERRYTYLNRRTQLFGEASLLLDPVHDDGFGIPAEYRELRRQLAVIPRGYDAEGRLRLPPKSKRTPGSKEKTLVDLIGHSPDEADAFCLSIFGLLHPEPVLEVGAL